MQTPPRAAPPLWHEAAALLFLLVGYDQVKSAASPHVCAADAAGRGLLRLEHLLHLDVERTLDHAVAPSSLPGQALALYYDLVHVLLTATVLVALRAFRPALHLPLRRTLVGTNLVALAVFLLHPVTPPRLLPGAGFVDLVAESGAWGTASGGVTAHADQYAALPSLHVAWAVWVLLVALAATRRRTVHVLAAAHVTVTVAVVLLTGNHYVVDVVAGGLLTLVCRAVCEVPVSRYEDPGVQAPVRQPSAP